MQDYLKLEEIFAKISKISGVQSLLSWDSAVNLPKASVESRSDQLVELQNIIHDLIHNPEIDELFSKIEISELNQRQQINLSLMKKAHLNQTIYPKDLTAAFIKATSIAKSVWEKARQENSFKDFAPSLKEVIKLLKEKGQIKSEKLNMSIYNALADSFEPGFNEVETDRLLSELKIFLVDLLPRVIERQKTIEIHKLQDIKIATAKQLELGKELMTLLGFDFSRGRIDVSAHPFCGGISDDCRITTNYDEDNFLPGILGIIHETGHANYEQSLPRDYRYQPLSSAISMATHESQSLIIEMQLARSKEFVEFLSNKLSNIAEHKSLNPDNLYRIINQVQPSLIRINADEVTYPLHVILRYELEKMLLTGELEVEDLPLAWNLKIQESLNIKVPSDKEGCLQDIHWSMGAFGYLPSYAIGAIMASQIYGSFKEKNKDFAQHVLKGDFTKLTKYLKDNIHSVGSLYNREELLRSCTSLGLNLESYKNYLQEKFINN